MAQLSKIVSSVLQDMIQAQHLANLHTYSLAEMYRNDRALEKFTLPSVCLSEVELDIQYAIKEGVTDTEQDDISYPETEQMITNLSYSCADWLIRNSIKCFNNVLASCNVSVENYVDNLKHDVLLRDQYCTFLSHFIHQDLREALPLFIERNQLDISTINRILKNVAEVHILRNDDVKEVFQKVNNISIPKKIRALLFKAIDVSASSLIKDYDLKHKRGLPSIDVVVGSDELAQLPYEAIHTLHIKLTPNFINLKLDEEP